MQVIFEIKKTVAQAGAGELIELIQKDIQASGTQARFPIIIGQEPNGGLIAYFEEVRKPKTNGDEDKGSALGRVLLTGDDLEEVKTMMNYDYSVRITAVNGDRLTAEMKTLTEEPKKKEETGNKPLTKEQQDYLDALVNDRLMTKENLDKRLAIAEEHGISFNLMKKLVFDGIRRRGIQTEMTPLKTMYVNTEKSEKKPVRFFFQAVGNCATGDAFILEGPKSVGKNVFCETLSFLFNKEYFVIQLNENTSDGDVYGEKSTDNTAAEKLSFEMAAAAITAQTLMSKGEDVPEYIMEEAARFELLKSQASSVKIVQALGVWVQWLQRGGIMVLNEMDMADANFFSQLVNMILDGTGFMTVPGYGRVDVNPECVLIGTQNGTAYAGTNTQNSASISRFDKYILPQPKDVIGQLKAAAKGSGFEIEDKYLITCNEFYKELLKLTAAKDEFAGAMSDTCLNIRGMVRALKAVKMFDYEVTLKERLIISVVNACAEDERGTIMTILNQKVSI